MPSEVPYAIRRPCSTQSVRVLTSVKECKKLTERSSTVDSDHRAGKKAFTDCYGIKYQAPFAHDFLLIMDHLQPLLAALKCISIQSQLVVFPAKVNES